MKNLWNFSQKLCLLFVLMFSVYSLSVITSVSSVFAASTSGLKNTQDYKGTGIFNIGGCGDINDPNKKELVCIVQKSLDGLMLIVGPLVVVMIILSGVFYMTSAANPTRVEQAKKTLVGSIIGLIIVVLAYTMVKLITVLFQ